MTIANSSFHAMSMQSCNLDQCPWSHLPHQYALQPIVPEASVNSCILVLGVQWFSRIKVFPDHCGRKSSHQRMSKRASVVSLMWWWSCLIVVLKSINLLRNIHPAGRILHANKSLPIRDNSSRFIHFLRACINNRSCNNDCFLSEVILASIDIVLRCMPRNVSDVSGPSILDGLMGTLSFLHSVSMKLRFCSHSSESAGPAVKKSSK